jgi:hypothetical protein
MSDRYLKPRLVFKRVENTKFMYEVGMAHYPGCFTPTGLREEHVDPIGEWCQQNNCGRRTSFTTFQFRNAKQVTMFLLRWNNG